ncbi:hypothetical protein HNV12_02520 [Methanococcoides sp. SA1]|nr:hypothetical protein [Methanococcoides sp. SA1]
MKDLNLFKKKDSLYLRKVSTKEEALSSLGCDGFLIQGEKTARSIIASLKDRKEKRIIAFIGGEDTLNRKAAETLRINYLVSPEKNSKFDTLKQRDSGLNHVVAKKLQEKNIKVIVDMEEISNLKPKERALRISKIIQNVKICRKVGCEIKIASFAKNKNKRFSEKVRKSFATGLAMSSKEVANSVSF